MKNSLIMNAVIFMFFFPFCRYLNVPGNGSVKGSDAKKKINKTITSFSSLSAAGVFDGNSFGSAGNSCASSSSGNTVYAARPEDELFSTAAKFSLPKDGSSSVFLKGTGSSYYSESLERYTNPRDIFYSNFSAANDSSQYYVYLNSSNYIQDDTDKYTGPASCRLTDLISSEETNTTKYISNGIKRNVIYIAENTHNTFASAKLIEPPDKNTEVQVKAVIPVGDSWTPIWYSAILYYQASSSHQFTALIPNQTTTVTVIKSASPITANDNTTITPGTAVSGSYPITVSVNAGEYVYIRKNGHTSGSVTKFCFLLTPNISKGYGKDYFECGHDEGYDVYYKYPADEMKTLEEPARLGYSERSPYINETINDVYDNYSKLQPYTFKGHIYITCENPKKDYYIEISRKKPAKYMNYRERYNATIQNLSAASVTSSIPSAFYTTVVSPIVIRESAGIDDHKLYTESSLEKCISRLKARMPAVFLSNAEKMKNSLRCGVPYQPADGDFVGGSMCHLDEVNAVQIGNFGF